MSTTALATSDCSSKVQISKDNGVITVKNQTEYIIYNCTDDVDAIEKALNEINNGVIFFKKGTYNIDRTVLLKSNVSFVGDEGVTFNCCFNGTAFSNGDKGYSPSTILLLNNAYSGDKQIKLLSTAGLRVGDYVKISDNCCISNAEYDFYSTEPTNNSEEIYYKNGEVVKIVAINNSNITINRPLYDTYTVTRNAKIKKISIFENINFENINFIGNGMETSSVAINYYGAQNCNISKCKFAEFGVRAISLCDCLNFVIKENVFKNVFFTGMGYGVSITNACDNITIVNNSFLEKGRHYIAVCGETGSRISDGLCRNVNVTNNTFENSTAEAVNTHTSNRCIFRVTDNKFFNCVKGIEFSNTNSLIMNNTFVGCLNGIELYGNGNHLIERNYFHKNYRSCTIETFSEIKDNLFNNGGYIKPICDTIIDDNKFMNYSSQFIYSTGTSDDYIENITISNNSCKDEIRIPIKLEFCKDLCINKNDLKGYYEFLNCGNVKIIDNKISSSYYCGIRIWNAQGTYCIRSNKIKAENAGIMLENTGGSPIEKQIIIKNNEIDAPTIVAYKGVYSSVVIELNPDDKEVVTAGRVQAANFSSNVTPANVPLNTISTDTPTGFTDTPTGTLTACNWSYRLKTTLQSKIQIICSTAGIYMVMFTASNEA